jgi:hypothetical protein
MSAFLEPREVAKPFAKRWLRTSLQLFVRSPIRFSILIALLGWLDASTVKVTDGFVIPKIWIQRLGMLLLPLLFAFISAVARGADDTAQTWKTFYVFGRARIWIGALGAGAAIVAFQVVIFFIMEVFFGSLSDSDYGKYSHSPGDMLMSFGAQTGLVSLSVGLCYAPLLVFWPDLSTKEARRLSWSATQVNNLRQMNNVVLIMLLIAVPLSLIPSYGMTEAAWLVFMGILNYVAYRDIFEQRDQNLPATARAARGEASRSAVTAASSLMQ